MEISVGRLRFKQHEIFNSIIGFIMINVMNDLGRFKESTKMFFHDSAMFINKTSVNVLSSTYSNTNGR